MLPLKPEKNEALRPSNATTGKICGGSCNSNRYIWSFHCGAEEMNLAGNHEVAGSIPDLTQWVKDPALP